MCAIKSISRLCIALAAAISATACCAAQEVSYTIAGDVPSPGTYSHPAGQPMDLDQLLKKGGVIEEKGIATILRRPSFETVSTNLIRPGTSSNRTPVAADDVVIFRRYEPNGVFARHAVLISGGAPRIVALTNNVHSLEQVMAAEGLKISGPANVSRVQWGATTQRVSLTGNEEVLHGDIVNVADAGPMSGLRITETFAPPIVQTSVVAVLPSEAGLSPVPSVASQTNVPPKPQSATLHIPDAASSSDMMIATVSETQTATAEFGGDGQMELRVPEVTEPEKIQTPFRTVSLENSLADTETIRLGESYQKSTANASGSPILNTVFTVGLLFAIGLIGLGWLKTQHEQKMEAEMAQSLQISDTAQATEVPEFAGVARTESDSVDSEAMVTTVSDDCPVLSAGIGDETTELPAKVIEETTQQKIEALAAEQAPWFDKDWSASDAELPTEKNLQPEPQQPVVTKSDLLEDLLQNRLPMELKQAQLPLQVALFGKPSGPQRIRIDTAHTTIAAPHMASSARRAKRKTPVASVKTTNDTAHNQQQRSDSGQSTADGSRFDRALNFLEEQTEK